MATFQAKLGPPNSVRNWQRNFAPLGLIVVGALAIRVAAALTWWRPGAIGQEGAEYARIAENLRNGLGYVGIGTPGTELIMPPLFPLLISLSSMFTGDYEWAGRLVAIVLGAALPLPVYGIASRLFDRPAAITAALIAACHPLFIGLSISVLSEGPYATLLLSAVYAVLRALDDRSTTKDWCLVGATFGLAYLTRQEAVAPLLIAVFFALVATPGTRVLKCKRGMAALVAFFVLASPQIAILYRATGHLRLEGKSAINFAIGSRMLAGQDQRRRKWYQRKARSHWSGDVAKCHNRSRDADRHEKSHPVCGNSTASKYAIPTSQLYGTVAWCAFPTSPCFVWVLSSAVAKIDYFKPFIRPASADNRHRSYVECRACYLSAKLFCVRSVSVDLGGKRPRWCGALDENDC